MRRELSQFPAIQTTQVQPQQDSRNIPYRARYANVNKEQNQKKKTYNTGDSPVVTDLSPSPVAPEKHGNSPDALPPFSSLWPRLEPKQRPIGRS